MADANDTLNDIDRFLWKWAEGQIGEGFILENIDASKVKAKQDGVVYQGQGDWFHTESLNEEIFNNDQNLPVTWSYNSNIPFSSKARWRISKTFKSSILPCCDIVLDFPGRVKGKKLLSVKYKSPNPDDPKRLVQINEDYPVDTHVTCDAYSSLEACAKLKTCRLQETPFKASVFLSGPITARGHKKRKSKNKMEVTAGVETALKGAPGINIVDDLLKEKGVMYSVEGVCSGEVPVEVYPSTTDLQTLV